MKIKSGVYFRLVVAVFHLRKVVVRGRDAVFLISDRKRPGMLLAVDGREHREAVFKCKTFIIKDLAVYGDRISSIGDSGCDAKVTRDLPCICLNASGRKRDEVSCLLEASDGFSCAVGIVGSKRRGQRAVDIKEKVFLHRASLENHFLSLYYMFPVPQPDPEKDHDDADDLREGDRFAEKQEGEEEGGGELTGSEKTAEAGGDVRHPAAKEERREEDTEEGEGNSVGEDRGKMRGRYRQVGRQKEENHHERAAYHEGTFGDGMDASPDAVHAEKAGGVGNRGSKSPKHAGGEGKGGSASDHARPQYSACEDDRDGKETEAGGLLPSDHALGERAEPDGLEKEDDGERSRQGLQRVVVEHGGA